MGSGASFLDPFGLCQEGSGRQRFGQATSAGELVTAHVPQPPFSPPYSAALPPGHDLDEALLQEALLISLADQEPPPPDDLEIAIQESLLSVNEPSPNINETAGSILLEGFLEQLGLVRLDVGSQNLSETGQVLTNQCFYLALSRSWLAEAAQAGGLLIRDSALQLKREIEAAVFAARGEGALNDIGEEREAFSDFLACAVQGEGPTAGSAMTDLAVVVFASGSGCLEAYIGRSYNSLPRAQQVANLVLVWHRPGHFEAVVAAGTQGKPDLVLRDVLRKTHELEIPVSVLGDSAR